MNSKIIRVEEGIISDKSSFPRVLIFGQPFNNFSGGGITLTNLFKGWPKEKISVTYLGHGLQNVTTDVCDIYYQLGREEHKWKFPFNLIQKDFPSGLKSFEGKKGTTVGFIQKGLRYKVVTGYFYPFLRWLGLIHTATTISVSERFKEWLSEFKPEILYLQVAALDEILFAREIIDYLNIPSVIHVMDDWPSAISDKGLFRKYWSGRIDREFKSLLDIVNLHLCISDAMSEEYLTRYKKRFIPFHNPIEIERWSPYIKKDLSIDRNNVRILYSGRIGDNGIVGSIIEVASAIDSMNGNESKIKLYIQTPTTNSVILNLLRKHKSVIINDIADYSEIPRIFSDADILLLANDFDPHGIKYLRFSMPTKASEYMISGTPVLLYTPEIAAVSKFFSMNECGHCITKQNREEIINGIHQLVNDEEYRKKLSNSAVRLAMERFNANTVRDDFQRLLTDLTKN
jgi:glycosyltransferase involved in cell wall biosynthesis